VKKHVVGLSEPQAPAADGGLLQGRAGGKKQHDIGDGLKQSVENRRERVGGLPRDADIA